jgi:hypothetical protein
MNWAEVWTMFSPVALGVCGYWVIRLDRRLESFGEKIRSEELKSARLEAKLDAQEQRTEASIPRQEFDACMRHINTRLDEILDRVNPRG